MEELSQKINKKDTAIVDLLIQQGQYEISCTSNLA